MKNLIFVLTVIFFSLSQATAQANLAESIANMESKTFAAESGYPTPFEAISPEMKKKVEDILWENGFTVLDPRSTMRNTEIDVSAGYLKMCCLTAMYLRSPEGLLIKAYVEGEDNGRVNTKFSILKRK